MEYNLKWTSKFPFIVCFHIFGVCNSNDVYEQSEKLEIPSLFGNHVSAVVPNRKTQGIRQKLPTSEDERANMWW